jgi:hypothetical protein
MRAEATNILRASDSSWMKMARCPYSCGVPTSKVLENPLTGELNTVRPGFGRLEADEFRKPQLI